MVACATMASDWRPFRRKTSRNHHLEAKIAVGGEPYGHPDMGYKAEKGQWICRNPDNGHCWSISEDGMEQLYVPLDQENDEWKALVEKFKKKKKRATIKKTSTKKPSISDKSKVSLF